jgi:uncharacterized protein (TIGR02996 family)
MPATRDVRRLYRALLANPGDRGTMLVFADALDEVGSPGLAGAYRWAAGRGRWPFRRSARGPDGFSAHSRTDLRLWQVWDWNATLEAREDPAGRVSPVPESAQLPPTLIRAIVGDRGRRYGGVNRAFLILARAIRAAAGQGYAD